MLRSSSERLAAFASVTGGLENVLRYNPLIKNIDSRIMFLFCSQYRTSFEVAPAAARQSERDVWVVALGTLGALGAIFRLRGRSPFGS